MKAILAALAMMVVASAPAFAMSEDLIRGMVYITAYDQTCKPGSVAEETHTIFISLMEHATFAERQQITEIANEVDKQASDRTMFCTALDFSIGPMIERINESAKRMLALSNSQRR